MVDPERLEFVRPYSGAIFNLIPNLIQKMSTLDWERTLEVIIDNAIAYRNNENMDVTNSVEEILTSLGKIDCDLIPYCVDEMSKIRLTYNPYAYRGSVNLETVILESIEQNSPHFSRKNLSNLHSLFFRLYSCSNAHYADATASFRNFINYIRDIPSDMCSKAIKMAHALVDYSMVLPESKRKDRELLRKMNALILAYGQGLYHNKFFLGNKLTDWVQNAFDRNYNLDDLLGYFTNAYDYFHSDLEQIAGGLPLSRIHGRLLSYVQALIGRPIKVDALQSSTMICSFSEDTFFFPRIINVSMDDKENYRIYKALASYQAATYLYGTYDFDISIISKKRNAMTPEKITQRYFFDSFGNPPFARRLFEILEFSRLDSCLWYTFPGLRRDIEFFKTQATTQLDSSEKDDLSYLLHTLTQYVYESRSCEGTDPLFTPILQKISALREKRATVKDTYACLDYVYNTLEGKFDLSHVEEIPTTTPIAFDFEYGPSGDERVATQLIAIPQIDNGQGKKYKYDEWDERQNKYKKEFVQVIETTLNPSDNTYVSDLLAKDRNAVQRLRRLFESIKPEEFELVRKQLSGDVDYDAIVRARSEMKAGITPSEKLYSRHYKNKRSVVSMILTENSGSLRKFLDLQKPELRLIDIIKHSQIFFAESLAAIGDRYALATFSGETEKNVQFFLVKDFDQLYDIKVQQTIGTINPMQQNRDGAGIRHATYILNQQPEKLRLLFYLMEGFPQDFGYKGEYAIEDTRKALIEAKCYGCVPVVLAYGKEISDKLRSLSDQALYHEIQDTYKVPELLPQIYMKITL